MEFQNTMLNKLFMSFLVFVLAIGLYTDIVYSYDVSQMPNLNIQKYILYYGEGCPHCLKVENFINKENLSHNIIMKEIYHNRSNLEEFNKLCNDLNVPINKRGVPFLYTGDSYFAGDKEIINFLVGAKKQKNIYSKNNGILTIPVLIGAALVDAINPCAFAVLLILLMTIMASSNRKNVLYSGFLFSLSIFISYLLMGLGIYSLFSFFEFSKYFMIFISFIAIIIGLLNIKDYFWYGKGFLMEVPLSWRGKLKSLIKGVTSPIGAFITGFLVSMFLLPCTSGPYIVVLGMLANKETFTNALGLLILYNFVFILPMILITLLVYYGYNPEDFEKKRIKSLKKLHLIAGIIMIILGLYILLFEI